MNKIAIAETVADVERCSSVMRELRPHIAAAEFARRVNEQEAEGYRLAYLESTSEVRVVAGFRVMEMLFSGRTLYVDDLVTRSADRSQGLGAQLFDWLVTHAIDAGCENLTLDSGVQRFAAHRFYLSHGMDITAHHFSMSLKERW